MAGTNPFSWVIQVTPVSGHETPIARRPRAPHRAIVSAIKTVFFDAAGTLFHLPKGVGAHYRDVAQRFGCDLNEDALSLAFRNAWREMPMRNALRQSRPDDDKGWWRMLVHRVLEHCGVPEQQLDRAAYFDLLYAEFALPGIWELYPEVREVLTTLRPRYRLGLISNFDGRLRAILRHLGLEGWFDPIIISSEAGADKPDAWIFERALTLAETTAPEALHVGDDPRCDWQGAADAGLRVFRLQRPGNSLRDLLAQLISNRSVA
jgi:putative hydrolase of the HAD superfamily